MKILVVRVLIIVFKLRIFVVLRNSRFSCMFEFFPVLFVRACVYVCVRGCDSVRGHISACVRVYIYVEG